MQESLTNTEIACDIYDNSVRHSSNGRQDQSI